MGKYWEFWCRRCGHHYYRHDPEMKQCTNDNCINEYLELAAIIDSVEHMDGFMGIDKVAGNRYPLDKRAS